MFPLKLCNSGDVFLAGYPHDPNDSSIGFLLPDHYCKAKISIGIKILC